MDDEEGAEGAQPILRYADVEAKVIRLGMREVELNPCGDAPWEDPYASANDENASANTTAHAHTTDENGGGLVNKTSAMEMSAGLGSPGHGPVAAGSARQLVALCRRIRSNTDKIAKQTGLAANTSDPTFKAAMASAVQTSEAQVQKAAAAAALAKAALSATHVADHLPGLARDRWGLLKQAFEVSKGV